MLGGVATQKTLQPHENMVIIVSGLIAQILNKHDLGMKTRKGNQDQSIVQNCSNFRGSKVPTLLLIKSVRRRPLNVDFLIP